MTIQRDPFAADAFSAVDMTATVNEVTPVPTVLGSMGLFQEDGIFGTKAEITVEGDSVVLVKTSNRYGSGQQGTTKARKTTVFKVPHVKWEDVINAEELENVLRTNGGLKNLESELIARQANGSRSIDLTLEFHRLGAVKGIVLDADGSELFDLFDEFGVAQPAAVNFALNSATTSIKKKCNGVTRSIAEALGLQGVPFKTVALCSNGFFDDFVSHAETKAAYERQDSGAFLRDGGLAYSQFTYAGITFINYPGASGVAIEDGKAHFFAQGIPGLFLGRYAAADRIEFVGEKGVPKYAFTDPDPKRRFLGIEVQSNPLFVCTKPKSLITGTAS